MKKDFRRETKTLIYDLEVSGSLGWAYGQWQTNMIKVEQPPILLALSWKWLGDKKVKGVTLRDFKQASNYDDSGIVHKLWGLLDECNIAVAYNGKKFDNKMANTFFIRHHLEPVSPYLEFDPLQVARRYFKFDNNKLDYLGKLLLGEGKTEVTYGDCWDKLLHGAVKEQKKYAGLMKRYCDQDVKLLEDIYYKLLPWSNNHPNMALCAGVDYVCPRCGKDSKFKVKAYRRTGVQITAIQFQCKNCKGYVTRPLSKEERIELADTGELKSIYRNSV